MMSDLLVMTQNICGVAPLWPWRRRLIARRIAQMQPDVIGLQEVLAPGPDGQGSQAHELAEQIGDYHVDFAPGRVGPDGTCEGVALLCRHGLRERCVTALTLDPADFWERAGQRVVLGSVIDLPAGPVALLVTHLSLSARARQRTVKELLCFAAQAFAGTMATVLLGDLNALPGEKVLHALESCEAALGGSWCDAWKIAHGERSHGPTWPAFWPVRRLDYVFVRPPSRWLVRACHREPPTGSDHLGVMAWLGLHEAQR
jgi:endonuclease/exonuclease/phosphatase family metal-dependent hydrolase